MRSNVSDMTLTTQLNTLESADLIRRAPPQPELEYLFRHALAQDAAYGSLLKQNRRALHQAVGETLERLHAERLDELAPVLGHHFCEADDHPRALKYFTRAGDLAAAKYANAEASLHYARALDIAPRVAPSALDSAFGGAPALFMHLFTKRGRMLEMSGQYERALANYREMETWARAHSDRSMELAALIARATIRSTPTAVHDPQRGQALSEQALALARELGERQAESKILWNLMLLKQFSGHMREAVQFGEQSLAIARELNLREQLAYTLNDIMRSYAGVGQFDRAGALLDEAGAIWRELGNIPMLTDNLGRSARILFAIGEYERAIAAADEARELSQSIDNLWGLAFCRMFVGYVYLERGEVATAIHIMEECIRFGEQAGLVMAQVGTRADLGWIYGTFGAIEHGLALSRHARTIAEQRLPIFRSWALGSLARLHVMKGDVSAAETLIREGYVGLDLDDLSTHGAIAVPLADAEVALAKQDYARAITTMDDFLARLRRAGVRPFVADALYLKGKALLAQGRLDEAHQILIAARAAAEALNSRRILWLILIAESEVEAQWGHTVTAQALRQQAREVVVYIADHCPSDLRPSFLALPHVHAVVI